MASDLTDKLVELIVSKLEAAGEVDQIGAVAERLRVEAARRQITTRVISPVELSAEQQDKLRAKLATAEIQFVVDPEILGGLIVEHDGRRTDLSWKARLTK